MGAGTAKAIAGAGAAAAFGPIGALAGPIIGGLFGRSGQNSANEANLAIARENREWQERMSNTAYQRSAADLKKAGLNRILALGQPATTPAGNIATMQNKNALLASGITSGVTAGLTARRLKAEITNIEARTNLTDAQRNVIRPAEGIGTGLGRAIDWIKNTLSPKNIDYGNLISETATSAKGALRKPKIEVQIGDSRTWNEYALKAVEQYVKEFPDATETEMRRVYAAAMKRRKK